MSSANDPEKKEPETPRPEGTTAESHKAAEESPLTEVEVLHTLVNEYKARDEQSYGLQRRNFWLGVVTACLVFAYATVAALQWYATGEANRIARDALTFARESFSKEQRPYVWIGQMTPPVMQAGQRVRWNFCFANYGKSPAIGVQGRAQVIFGRDRERRIDAALFTRFPPNAQESAAIIPPGSSDPQWVTAWSNETLSLEDVRNVGDPNVGVRVLLYLEYFDTNGNWYFTKMCRHVLETETFGVCDTQNEIH